MTTDRFSFIYAYIGVGYLTTIISGPEIKTEARIRSDVNMVLRIVNKMSRRWAGCTNGCEI
uniref:Uncharacterized protein n=1 Tax=Glossina palpalis gambiensis TaxID=67801 RepID=A0A1B0B050_9MUSC